MLGLHPKSSLMSQLNRRTFIKNTAIAAAVAGLSARSFAQSAGANGDLRVAVVGFLAGGLLLSGAAFTDGLTVVHTGTSVPSAPHIAMTVAMLREAGVEVDDATANRWHVRPGPIAARSWVVEPDLSNSVPFLAAAVVTGGMVRIAGWPRVSVQPAGMFTPSPFSM